MSSLLLFKCLPCLINRMHAFKTQTVKQLPPTPNTQPQITPPLSVQLDIQSIVYLNYPIETLGDIVRAHFESEGADCISANLVVRALKVISISLKDSKLRTNIEAILSENMHQRQLMYRLFVFWGACSPNILPIISKISPQLTTRIITNLFSCQFFLPDNTSNRIQKLICSYVEECTGEGCSSLARNIKDEYILLDSPLRQFITSVVANFIDGQSTAQIEGFFNQLVGLILKTKQSLLVLRETLAPMVQLEASESLLQVDSFFYRFPAIWPIYIEALKPNIKQPHHILRIWSHSPQFKMEGSLKTVVKEWINEGDNYWRIFDEGYEQTKLQTFQRKRITLFQIGQQLLSDRAVSECLTKKYLFNYFEGLNFQLEKQNAFLFECGKIKNCLNSYSLESLNEMIKAQSQCSSKGGVNLILINTLAAPRGWSKIDVWGKDVGKVKLLAPYLEKIQALYEKIKAKCDKKSQKIELAYHIITVEYDGPQKGVRQKIQVTLEQLMNLIRNPLKPIVSYRTSLEPQTDIKSFNPTVSASRKDLHGIVIEALLVKALKKSKNPLSKGQLFRLIGQPEQQCTVPLQKILSKGLAELVQSNETYRYVP